MLSLLNVALVYALRKVSAVGEGLECGYITLFVPVIIIVLNMSINKKTVLLDLVLSDGHI